MQGPVMKAVYELGAERQCLVSFSPHGLACTDPLFRKLQMVLVTERVLYNLHNVLTQCRGNALANSSNPDPSLPSSLECKMGILQV